MVNFYCQTENSTIKLDISIVISKVAQSSTILPDHFTNGYVSVEAHRVKLI